MSQRATHRRRRSGDSVALTIGGPHAVAAALARPGGAVERVFLDSDVQGARLETVRQQALRAGVPVSATFSGLTPLQVGLYQVNVQVPENSPAGDAVPVVLTIGSAVSNTATIAVR